MPAPKNDSPVAALAFDGSALRHALTAVWQEGLDDTKLKLAALSILSEAVTAGRSHVKKQFATPFGDD